MDGELKTAVTVSELLDATLHVLKPESLDSPPRPLGELPAQLAHYAPELPPTPPSLADRGASPASSEEGQQQADQQAAVVVV